MSSRGTIEVARLLGIPEAFIVELCDAGIVAVEEGLISEFVVERVRVSWTMHQELGVNLAGIEVALHLLSLIERERRWHHEDL